ncbi:Conserved_hypothetical protein [Hexamita inflata]|uniref:Uncharacterized protein n=1 Tax=Hexamita inflata TaxID=28002 RepID=A0AA86R9K7_9EUKA|nr:Conserved hypothetical protein [Hexamita inflata]
MRQQKQQQLSNFDEVFIQAVNNKTNLKFVTIQDAHQEFINRQNGVVFDIWKDMAVILNISAKKVHDYYHNTWSKQFYDGIEGFKSEILELITQMDLNVQIKENVQNIVKTMKDKHQNVNFHYQTMYQFINYHMKNNIQKLQSEQEQKLTKQMNTGNLDELLNIVLNAKLPEENLEKIVKTQKIIIKPK